MFRFIATVLALIRYLWYFPAETASPTTGLRLVRSAADEDYRFGSTESNSTATGNLQGKSIARLAADIQTSDEVSTKEMRFIGDYDAPEQTSILSAGWLAQAPFP